MSTRFLGGERNAKRWRRFEAEVRVIALSMADLESERVLLSVADDYKRLPGAPTCAMRNNSSTAHAFDSLEVNGDP